jgi:hypothetical protein
MPTTFTVNVRDPVWDIGCAVRHISTGRDHFGPKHTFDSRWRRYTMRPRNPIAPATNPPVATGAMNL